MWSGASPVFVMVSVNDAEKPLSTTPKSRESGETAMTGPLTAVA